MESDMENIDRAESSQIYLRRRLEKLNVDRQELESRINAIKYETDEIENKIQEINNEFDSAYEVFSPKPKDKGFDRKEISSLQLRKNELSISLNDFLKEHDLVVKDIMEIKDILKTNDIPEINEDDISYPIPDTMPYTMPYTAGYISGYDILEQRENERKKISMGLREKTISPLDNLMHKCEICSKILKQDTARAKLELEIMSGIIKDTIDNTKDIINYLNPVEMEGTDFDAAVQVLQDKLQTDIGMTIKFEMSGNRINMPSIMETTILRTIVDGINGIVGFLNADIFKGNIFSESDVEKDIFPDSEIYLFLKYEEHDFNGVYIVIENKSEKSLNSDNMEENDVGDISYEVKNDFGLFMIEENVYLLGGDVKIEAFDNKKIKIEITIPIPNMD